MDIDTNKLKNVASALKSTIKILEELNHHHPESGFAGMCAKWKKDAEYVSEIARKIKAKKRNNAPTMKDAKVGMKLYVKPAGCKGLPKKVIITELGPIDVETGKLVRTKPETPIYFGIG
jgi:hypothetical protein